MIVKIKDFNCIEDMELEFHPGFTILQGPSNSGKSSVIKAIENTIFNQSGTTNVRQGQSNYKVGIKKGDNTVSLIKGKNSKYKINENIYEKFGVGQLTEVADILNIRETILGGEKVRLNFSKQLSYPFLLDKTPGQLYKFIVDSSESESLSNVLKDINKDIKTSEKSIVQNEAQLDLLINQQSQLQSNLKNSSEIIKISNQILELDSINSNINKLIALKDTYNSCKKDRIHLDNLYKKLSFPLDLASLETTYTSYTNIESLYDKYKTLIKNKNILSSYFNRLSLDFDIGQLDKLEEDYISLLKLVNEYTASKRDLNKYNIELNDLNQALMQEQEKLNTFDICPLCGSRINHEEV